MPCTHLLLKHQATWMAWHRALLALVTLTTDRTGRSLTWICCQVAWGTCPATQHAATRAPVLGISPFLSHVCLAMGFLTEGIHAGSGLTARDRALEAVGTENDISQKGREGERVFYSRGKPSTCDQSNPFTELGGGRSVCREWDGHP